MWESYSHISKFRQELKSEFFRHKILYELHSYHSTRSFQAICCRVFQVLCSKHENILCNISIRGPDHYQNMSVFLYSLVIAHFDLKKAHCFPSSSLVSCQSLYHFSSSVECQLCSCVCARRVLCLKVSDFSRCCRTF